MRFATFDNDIRRIGREENINMIYYILENSLSQKMSFMKLGNLCINITTCKFQEFVSIKLLI